MKEKETFALQCHLENIQKCHFPGAAEGLGLCGVPWPESPGTLQPVECTANIFKVYDFK